MRTLSNVTTQVWPGTSTVVTGATALVVIELFVALHSFTLELAAFAVLWAALERIWRVRRLTSDCC